LQGREFVVTSVFVTMARNTAGAGDRGSTARFGLVMHLAELQPDDQPPQPVAHIVCTRRGIRYAAWGRVW
jgi:hypothetical protein